MGERPSARGANGTCPCASPKNNVKNLQARLMSPADLQCSELRQSWTWTLAETAPAATWDRVGPRLEEASTRALFRARTSRKHPPPGHPPRQMGAWTARAGPWEPARSSGEAGHRWGGRRGRRQMGAMLAPAVRQRRRADVCDQMFRRVRRGPGKNRQASFLHPSLAAAGESLGSQGSRSGSHG